ncbi:MAG: S8 family serine peptidase [Verrucomicrobia bacterium]|nr:S8 family serine peptidase [Verrucomicrobiota bacterium]
MSPRFIIATLTLIIGLLAGWLLFQTQEQPEDYKGAKNSIQVPLEYVPSNPISDRQKNNRNSDRNTNFDPNAIPYERVVAFSSEEAYRNFLKKLAASRVRNKGTIDSLRAVRIGFDSLTDLDSLGLEPEDVEFNYPVLIPELREVEPQQGVVGFGNGALDFLGISKNNSEWGRGVKIAVIDTGIEPHLALNDNIQHINLIELNDGENPNSHGTSVASLIAGQHPNMRGVAPQAELISVRVADETGVSSSFLLAQGIIAAADAGAQLINISMGSSSDSTLVRQAVDYAIEQGSVIFASSGNDGTQQASYPAADPDVYSVGAIDANGTHLNFSNTDENLAFTAPGLEVQAAFPGDNVTSFTGTSGAVAFPVGAVAAIMSESQQSISAQQAVLILQNHSNEAGLPGADNQFGIGIIDVGRAINRNTSGIVDVAVASQTYLLPTADSSASGLQVSVENRGTETVFQSTVDIQIGNDYFPYTIQKLNPNERTVITIPSGLSQLRADAQLEVSAHINLPNGQSDAKPGNDQRKEIVTIPTDDR